MMFRSKSASSNQDGGAAAAPQTANSQIVDDIRATRTSRMVDEMSIVEELEQTSSNFRQYCELVGTSQTDSSVVAPYSKLRVAYYDVRCFRIERVNGKTVETLVAHEKSMEPFSFSDGTTDRPVFVNLDSFGENCILVNTTNRIEGPQSEFTKAFNKAASLSTSSSGGVSFAVGRVREAGEGLLESLARAWQGLKRPLVMPRMQPAFAGAGGGTFVSSQMPEVHSSLKLAGPSGPGGPVKTGGRPGVSGHSVRSPYTGHNSNNPFMSGNIPMGLDGFLGLGGMGGTGLNDLGTLGGPRGFYYYSGGRGSSADLGSMMLTVGLGALLNSLSSTATPASAQAPTQVAPQVQNTFIGYRIVEDVVPLRHPIYALGELYRVGGDFYMGASLSKSNPSSYFATKLEHEVIQHLGGR